VLSLCIPPLRDRKEDIEILLYYLIHKHGKTIAPSAINDLITPFCAYSWPGNIRELENIAEYISTINNTSKDFKENILNLIFHSPENQLVNPIHENPLENLLFRTPKTRVELMCILQILRQVKLDHLIIGRDRLQELLLKKNLLLTTQQVKSRLEILRQSGLISTHNGKGSILTAAGERQLVLLEEPEKSC